MKTMTPQVFKFRVSFLPRARRILVCAQSKGLRPRLLTLGGVKRGQPSVCTRFATGNLFHCFSEFLIFPKKLVHYCGSIDPFSWSDSFYEGWDLVVEINGNVQFHIGTIKLASFTFRKIVLFSHIHSPYVLISCLVAFRLEITLIVTALSPSSRKVWTTMSFPFFRNAQSYPPVFSFTVVWIKYGKCSWVPKHCCCLIKSHTQIIPLL